MFFQTVKCNGLIIAIDNIILIGAERSKGEKKNSISKCSLNCECELVQRCQTINLMQNQCIFYDAWGRKISI